MTLTETRQDQVGITAETNGPGEDAGTSVAANRARRRLDRRRRIVWAWGAVGEGYKGSRYGGHIDSDTVAEVAERVWGRLRGGERGLTNLESCGRFAQGGEVVLKRSGRGKHYLSGRTTCSAVWACPACAPQIRQGRAVLVQRQLGRVQDEHPGSSVLFLTLTIRHGVSLELGDTLGAVMGVWSGNVVAGKAYATDRERFGVLGWVRTVEVTYSRRAGHHPHIHAALVLDRVLSDAELAGLEARIYNRWSAGVARAGLPVPSPRRGVVLRRVGVGRDDVATVGAYLSKTDTDEYTAADQDPDRWLSDEVARGDRKPGRGASLGPFQLVDLAGTPDEGWARSAYQTYQRATHGRRFMTAGGVLRGALRLSDWRLVHDATEPHDAEPDWRDLIFDEPVSPPAAAPAADDWPPADPDDVADGLADQDDVGPDLDDGPDLRHLVTVDPDDTAEAGSPTWVDDAQPADGADGADGPPDMWAALDGVDDWPLGSLPADGAPGDEPGPDSTEEDRQFLTRADRADEVVAVFDAAQWAALRDDRGGEGLMRFLDLLDAGRCEEAWGWAGRVLVPDDPGTPFDTGREERVPT